MTHPTALAQAASVLRKLASVRDRARRIPALDRSISGLETALGLERPKYYCPVCGYHGPFGPGPSGRPDALCPKCQSLERHRLIWLYLSLHTNFHGAKHRMLHFAPEVCFRPRFSALPNLDYLTVDLSSPRADIQADIQNLPMNDAEFDVLFCSHVLEHIPDDRKAMSELFRVVRPGGWALINVPIRNGATYEDPSITSPEERARHFGQHDHVRYYGVDIQDRLRAAGFEVKVEHFARRFEKHLQNHFRIADEVLFYCVKPS